MVPVNVLIYPFFFGDCKVLICVKLGQYVANLLLAQLKFVPSFLAESAQLISSDLTITIEIHQIKISEHILGICSSLGAKIGVVLFIWIISHVPGKEFLPSDLSVLIGVELTNKLLQLLFINIFSHRLVTYAQLVDVYFSITIDIVLVEPDENLFPPSVSLGFC